MNFDIICNSCEISSSSNLNPNAVVIPIKTLEFKSQMDITNAITTFYHIDNNEKLLNSFFFSDVDSFSLMEMNIEYYKNGVDFINYFKHVLNNDISALKSLIHIVSQFTSEGVFEFKVKCFVIVLCFHMYSKNNDVLQYIMSFLNENGYLIYWRFILACPSSKGVVQGVKRHLNNELKIKLQEKFKLIKYKYNWKVNLKSSDLK